MTAHHDSPSHSAPVVRPLVARAIWLGILTGVVEASVPLTQKFAFERMRIHTSVHIAWMAPLADALFFSAVALLLAAVVHLARHRLGVRRGLAAATGVLVALAVWSVTVLYPQLYDWAALLLSLGAGVQVARTLSGDGAGLDRLVRRTLVPLGAVVAIAAGVLLIGPRWRESRAVAALPPARTGAPNVLLLILDTVRAQSLSLGGPGAAARRTSPRLDAFGAQGVVFDYALSSAPWTLPSHASMFTGHYPHELTADWLTPLDDTTPTLGEVLQRHGYATGGFVGNYMVSWEVGLRRGFLHYEDYERSPSQLLLSSAVLRKAAYWPTLRRVIDRYDSANRKSASAVNAGLLDWIAEQRDRPFFAFVNYMDAHEFYNPPDPYRLRFGPDSARKHGLIRYGLGGVGYRAQKGKMKPHEVAAELNAYEASIAALDHQIGVLFDTLAARGVLDNTVVIISSDHGEHFGEHKRWEHASSLYPQLLHVPLVMRAPGRVPAGRRVTQFVTLRDLAATILAVGPASEELPGRTLTRFWDSTAVSAARADSPIIASITNGFWNEQSPPKVRRGMRSILVDGVQVIEDVNEGHRVELFDLRSDPRGERELARDTTLRALEARALAALSPVVWRSQARGVARQAGEIGAPQQP